jgi:hypothetical protein
MATEITEQIVREAPQIEAYKLGLLQAAKNLSEQKLPLPAYQVAGLSGQQQEAANLASQGIGAYQPFLQAGQKAIEAGIGAAGGAIGAPTQTDLQSYLNPFTQNVIDTTAAQMRRQGQIAQQGTAAQAVRAGAFGGTREGVQRAEMERNLQDQMANMAAQQYAQNYAQAQNLYGQQQGRTLQAGQLYGTLGVQQAALGEAQQRLAQGDVNALMTIGQQGQQQAQAVLDAQRATGLQESLTPYQQLSFLSDIYKGAPGTQIGLTSQSAPSTSPLLQAAGIGIAGISAAAGGKKAGLF